MVPADEGFVERSTVACPLGRGQILTYVGEKNEHYELVCPRCGAVAVRHSLDATTQSVSLELFNNAKQEFNLSEAVELLALSDDGARAVFRGRDNTIVKTARRDSVHAKQIEREFDILFHHLGATDELFLKCYRNTLFCILKDLRLKSADNFCIWDYLFPSQRIPPGCITSVTHFSSMSSCIAVTESPFGMPVNEYLLRLGPSFAPKSEGRQQIIEEIGRQLSVVLEALHDRGVIHCDVKPSNIVVSRTDAQVCLIDFGISCIIGTLGEAGGTPGYASDSILAGNPPTKLDDWHSLAITLHALWIGEDAYMHIDPSNDIILMLDNTVDVPVAFNLLMNHCVSVFDAFGDDVTSLGQPAAILSSDRTSAELRNRFTHGINLLRHNTIQTLTTHLPDVLATLITSFL